MGFIFSSMVTWLKCAPVQISNIKLFAVQHLFFYEHYGQALTTIPNKWQLLVNCVLKSLLKLVSPVLLPRHNKRLFNVCFLGPVK